MKLKSAIILSLLFIGFVVPKHSSGQLRVKNEELRIQSLQNNCSPFTVHCSLPNDTIPKTDTAKKHSPRRAAIYSAVLPGLGQVYNKQYWKVPIIYAGGTIAGYLIYYNYSVYSNLRKAYRYRRDEDSTTSNEKFEVWEITGPLKVDLENFDDGEVLELQTTYRRDLDLSVLLAFGIYALNIVDAVVYGHLYDFDVSDDLSLRLQPDFHYAQSGLVKPAMQLSLSYRF